MQPGQSVTLSPMIEASQLMTLQSLLSLLEQMRRGAALKRLVQKQRDALAHLREGHRRGPCFSPVRFLVPETTWPGTTAFDAAANPSSDAPHRPPTRLRLCCAEYTLQCDARLWPLEHIPTLGGVSHLLHMEFFTGLCGS